VTEVPLLLTEFREQFNKALSIRRPRAKVRACSRLLDQLTTALPDMDLTDAQKQLVQKFVRDLKEGTARIEEETQ
jgi:hypothetical protein